MHSQHTPQSVVEKEKKLIASLLNLNNQIPIELNDIGWDSRLYIINSGEFVFKFPRSEQVKNAYKLEVAGYKLASKINSDVKVPMVKWEPPDYSYFGYEGIVGHAMDKLENSLSDDVKIQIGVNVGGFLRQLHQLKLENAKKMSIEDEIKEFQYKYELGLQVIRERFSLSEQVKIENLIRKELPNKLISLGSNVGLCHGDLGYWNIIYGNNSQIGIIDFGDIGYYDTSKDFIGLDDEILENTLQTYGDNKLLREKITIRKKVLAILDLPFFFGKNDEKGIQNTIKRIRVAIS